MDCNNSDNGRIVGNTISDYVVGLQINLAYCDHVVVDGNIGKQMAIRWALDCCNQCHGVNATFTSILLPTMTGLEFMSDGSDHVVSNNIVNNNGGTSTASASPSYRWNYCWNERQTCTLTGNTANNNNQCGIYVSNQGHTVSGNTATGNTQVAILDQPHSVVTCVEKLFSLLPLASHLLDIKF